MDSDPTRGEVELTGGGRTRVVRRGGTIHRETGPWARSVHAYLRHLEDVGFTGAPRVVGDGFDDAGREVLTFMDGEVLSPSPWSDDAAHELGRMLRALHDAAEGFVPPTDAAWRPWHGRDLGAPPDLVGHCDLGPWNVISRDGMPVAFIDWEVAGPVDRRVEVAQAAWLNAQLHDDDVAERCGLGDASHRAGQLRIILDAYGLMKADRVSLVELMIDFAVSDAVAQVSTVDPTTTDADPLWAVTWRVRSADWMRRHRQLLERTLG